MNLKLEKEFSKADIVWEVTELKQQIDAQRPLQPDVEGRVMQKLRLEWNYNSNAIEGNRLSYGETTALLMHGITAKGKPLKDHLDIKGHNEGILYLESMVKDGRPLTEADIRSLHEIILVEPYRNEAQTADGKSTSREIRLGQYKTMPNHVKTITGEIHYYASPEETPAKMHDLMEWYNAAINDAEVHPVVIAALFHHKFAAIHPFDDGNGRMARILMNLILMQNGYLPVVIKLDDRQNYYSLLSRADNGDFWQFVNYNLSCALLSLDIYLKAIKGEEIIEEDDIDKKIALFRMEANDLIHLKEEASIDTIKRLVTDEIFYLFKTLLEKLLPINDLFLSYNSKIYFKYFDESDDVMNHEFSLESHRLRVENFDINNLKDLIFRINFEQAVFSKVYLELNHFDFKNINNMFSIKNTIAIEFFRYSYYISIGDTKSNLKYYSEKLDDTAKNKILDYFIESFIDNFNGNKKGQL